MTIPGIIAWIIANIGTIVKVLQTIDSLAVVLIQAHGNSSSVAYTKAVSAVVSSMAPQTTPEEDQTIGRQLQAP